jgi:UrcA family protein
MNANINITRSTFAACSAAIILASAFMVGSVFAADTIVSSEVVKFQDLNVNSPAGVTALYQRIHVAALHVCSAGSTEDLSNQRQYKKCTQDAETHAISKVNAPALTAYYEEKTGRLIATLAGN